MTEAGSQYDDENSVCSSAMADLSVSMQTATSILSHGVSEMHLDLQSYSKYKKHPPLNFCTDFKNRVFP